MIFWIVAIAIAASAAHKLSGRKRPAQVLRKNLRVCKICRKPVNFYNDVFDDAWYHVDCFERKDMN